MTKTQKVYMDRELTWSVKVVWHKNITNITKTWYKNITHNKTTHTHKTKKNIKMKVQNKNVIIYVVIKICNISIVCTSIMYIMIM